MLSYYRRWMYSRKYPNSNVFTEEFMAGVNEFLVFASSHPECMDLDKIRCPCTKCRNNKFLTLDDVKVHLFKRGFIDGYFNWTCHGEMHYQVPQEEPGSSHFIPQRVQQSFDNSEQLNWCQQMLHDGLRHNFVPPRRQEEEEEEQYGVYSGAHDATVDSSAHFGLENKFYDVVKAAEEPLYAGCDDVTQLSAMTELLNIKEDHNLSENCIDSMLQWGHHITPRDCTLPTTYYQSKKLLRDLGLPLVEYDACVNGCMLFWKNAEENITCTFCGQARYKFSKKKGKRVSRSVLHYLPLTPRLQRLYASNITAEHMTWHARHETEEGLMCHPSDGEAWKHFDRVHRDFSLEPRNVRLGLCSDGFSPFSQFGQAYSCWPVIVTPYNLPPGMCMKNPYMFLSLLIPGPGNPKKLIDVYLQPLIEELKQLWEEGAPTFDANKDCFFTMRAALLWTINDFPACGMLGAWSTHGIMGCSICMEFSRAFYLHHSRKPCYFDCHRQFLPANHSYRRDIKSFRRDVMVYDPPPIILSGSQKYDRVRGFASAIEDPLRHLRGFGKEHKWTKRSIFWDLPYWTTNLIRHNLDVMHIEKNVFDNIFNTVMDVKGKTKDHVKARHDVAEYCNRPEIAIRRDSSDTMKKAIYTLTKDQKKAVCQWVQQLRLPDGVSSKMARCVDMSSLKLNGMKSHDCHVFMQLLLPIAFKKMLPESVWGPLTEVSLLFQTICSSVVDVHKLRQLEVDAPLILCNLEKIFPPSFFDSMEHLLVHLPYEARVGGPVQYRWMYPFERFLRNLKRKVKNKARVEGSICQAYLREEISFFASHYFDFDISSKRRRPNRSDDTSNKLSAVSIFNYLGHGHGSSRRRWLENDIHSAHTYILLNCAEIDPYYRMFTDQLRQDGYDNEAIDATVSKWFTEWFSTYVQTEEIDDAFLKCLAYGPSGNTKNWHSYTINGFNFHTSKCSDGRSSLSTGVHIKSAGYGDGAIDFYGILEDVVECNFEYAMKLNIVLFKCNWIDPVRGTRIHPKYHIVEVNLKKKYNKNEPFILASQAQQVYYATYPSVRRSNNDWTVALKIKPRGIVDTKWKENEVAYQSHEVAPSPIVTPIQSVPLNDPTGINLFVDLSHYQVEDEDHSDESDDSNMSLVPMMRCNDVMI